MTKANFAEVSFLLVSSKVSSSGYTIRKVGAMSRIVVIGPPTIIRGLVIAYLILFSSIKYHSQLMPAVVRFVRICVTGTNRGLILITRGRRIPGFVILMWSPFWRLTKKPSNSKTLMSFL